ncbi:amino acid permease-domain-containing protein [Chytridium lagenaria]|nr:amino acid permease-domain-containing protein [Chytridium lagenaria]
MIERAASRETNQSGVRLEDASQTSPDSNKRVNVEEMAPNTSNGARRRMWFNKAKDEKKRESVKKRLSETRPKHRLGMLRGVFIPTFQNIVGIIVFVRFAWIVGVGGIGHALIITFLSTTLTFLTGLSMCAIVTNGRVPGGGAYYMISRSLGKEFGGAVGILFWLGNVVGCAMYILGVVEILMTNIAPQWSFGSSANDGRIYGTIILFIVSVIVATGFEVFQSIALLFFSAVVLALMSSFLGLLSSNRTGLPSQITGFPGLLVENWGPSYGIVNMRGGGEHVSLFDLFGVFFPAVTGVLAGSSRSGELEDPQRDIPRGTLLAHLVSTIIYYAFVLLLGTVVEGSLLRQKTALVMATLAWHLIMSRAALHSLVSGPRLLQAMAKDHIAPVLKVFQALSKKPALCGLLPANEPRRALFVSILIAEAAILVGSLDTVTKIYYHWFLSFIGAIMALAFGFIISWIVSLCALVAMVLLFKYIEYNGAQVQWGDGLQAVHLQVAQRNLWTLERDQSEHVKNWKPHIVLFVKMKEAQKEGGDGLTVEIRDPEILDLLSAMKKGGGLTVLATVHPSQNLDHHADAPVTKAFQETLRAAAKEHKVNAFTQVLVSPSVHTGIISTIQCTGIGHLRPNTVMLGWPRQPDEGFVNLIKAIISLDRALLLVKGHERKALLAAAAAATAGAAATAVTPGGIGRRRNSVVPPLRMNGVGNAGSSSGMLGFCNSFGNTCTTLTDPLAIAAARRVDMSARPSAIHAAFFEKVRSIGGKIGPRPVPGSPLTLARNESIMSPQGSTRSSSDNVFQNVTFEVDRLGKPKVEDEEPPVKTGTEDKPIDLWTVHGIPRTRENSAALSPLAEEVIADEIGQPPSLPLPPVTTSTLSNIDIIKPATPRCFPPSNPSPATLPTTNSTIDDAIHAGPSLPSVCTNLPSAATLDPESMDPRLLRMNTAVKLNELFRAKSANARLVLCNLPAPGGCGGAMSPLLDYDANEYLEYIDALTEGIPRIMLVKGTGFEVVTSYY